MSFRSPAMSALGALTRYRDAMADRGSARASAGECPVCLGQHEEEIHTATVRVHRWFRGEVTKGMGRSLSC